MRRGEQRPRAVPDGPSVPADELERALLDLRGRIEDAVHARRSSRARPALAADVPADEAAVRAAVTDLVREAAHSVDVVLGTDPAQVRGIRAALAEALLAEGPSRPAADGGVRVRLLCHPCARDVGPAARLGETRESDVRLLAAVLVDGRAALVSAGPLGARRATVVRAPAVARTLHALFRGVWQHAARRPEPFDFAGRARAATARRILHQLQLGATDQAAARDLAVSVRTYRRYVAEIMAMLGATSRFQAGVRAAELGLLGEQPHSQLPVTAVEDRPATG